MSENVLPKNWEEWSLADVGSWLGGGTPSKSSDRFWSGHIPWVSPKDMKSLTIFDTEDHISEEAVEHSAAKMISSGAVLFVTRSGILAHSFPVATAKTEVTINQDLKAIIPEPVINSEYLAWCLRAKTRSILDDCTKDGTTVHSIEVPSLKAYRIPVAPLAEQRRIVAKIEELFSELDKGVESLTTAREQLKVYRQVILQQAADGNLLVARGYRTSPFGDAEAAELDAVVAELGQGWSPRCLNHPSATEEEWAVIKTTAIQHLAFSEAENKQLPESLQPRPHLCIQPGDILVTRAGPRKRVGVACLVRSCRKRLMLCDKAYRLRVDEAKITPQYLELLLNSPKILDDIERLKTGINDSGVNLTQDRFLTISIFLPPIFEQEVVIKELESVLSQIDHLSYQIDHALEQVESLRQSILKKAFSGQLVTQDTDEEPASVLLERIKVERGADRSINGRRRRKEAA
jgi:type I restriction enzyme, S subunit